MAYKDAKAKDRKSSPWTWALRDREAEAVDKSLGHQTREEWVKEVLRGRGGNLSDERKRDIEDLGYHEGYSLRVPSWDCPFRDNTQQYELWQDGWLKGRRDREGRMKEGLDY